MCLWWPSRHAFYEVSLSTNTIHVYCHPWCPVYHHSLRVSTGFHHCGCFVPVVLFWNITSLQKRVFPASSGDYIVSRMEIQSGILCEFTGRVASCLVGTGEWQTSPRITHPVPCSMLCSNTGWHKRQKRTWSRLYDLISLIWGPQMGLLSTMRESKVKDIMSCWKRMCFNLGTLLENTCCYGSDNDIPNKHWQLNWLLHVITNE